MPCSVATEFSILRATSVSICAGAAPGRLAVTVTVGRSMSGNCWIFMRLKAITPSRVSMTNSSIAGIGLRIDQAETFMAGAMASGAAAAHDAHGVAVGEEADAAGDHPASASSRADLDALADRGARSSTLVWRPWPCPARSTRNT